MAYLFLIDVVRTIHCGHVACISTKELAMRMPSSSYKFHQLYSIILSGARALPSDLKSTEDGLLLLVGICADILSIEHTFSNTTVCSEALDVVCPNPYAPLSSASEVLRIRSTLSSALTRWYEHFQHTTSKDVLLIYYFGRLLLAFPDVLALPYLARYAPSIQQKPGVASRISAAKVEVSEEAMRFAWLILNDSNARTAVAGTTFSVWLPVVLFYSALTIWYQLRSQPSFPKVKTGTLRILNFFKDELKCLPWPCCLQMCHTLDGLLAEAAEIDLKSQ